MISIHDPVHGTIEVSPQEIKLIDTRPFQRLRNIKQLGFSELAFPGASHTRYTHSLGAMQMATRMIDRILASFGADNGLNPLHKTDEARIRQLVRLAVLFHDLGHAPMSHVSERIMPGVRSLNIGASDNPLEQDRQATHEDYTVKLLLDSELTSLIEKHVGDRGVTPQQLAGLLTGCAPPDDPEAFIIGGHDFLPLMSQIVSSEMDADRMDYLRRDAYYCGVSYGNFDHTWLANSLTAVQFEGRLGMALGHKGVWAFENFLLARHHMFLSVYYHHTAICFDHLLGRFYDSGEYTLPSDAQAYIETDDIDLMYTLKKSKDPWARAIIERRPYRLLLETHSTADHASTRRAETEQQLDSALEEDGIDFFRVRKKAVLSKYFQKDEKVFPLLVVEREIDRITRIEDYTPLYRRFQGEIGVSRVFCKPQHYKRARKLLADL